MTVRNPGININVHVKNDTYFDAHRVPSEADTDFVSVRIGWEVSILLMNSAQAKALADAAVEAFRLLKQIETDAEATALIAAAARTWDLDEPDFEDDTIYPDFEEEASNCTIENPCSACRAEDNYDYYDDYDYEPEPF